MEPDTDLDPQANQPAHEIIPRLWLGNKAAALEQDWLRRHNIDVVFNATKDLPFANVAKRQYRVPVDDNLEPDEIYNMAQWAPEIIYNVLKEYNAGNNILIHCFAGMQRSAAIVAMTLIVLKQMKTDEAIAAIKEKRRIAFYPGANFYRSIQDFERYYYSYLIPLLRGETPTQA
jgi:protein-tyrosine phosphatase